MSATAAFILFSVFCATILAAYWAGWCARASQESAILAAYWAGWCARASQESAQKHLDQQAIEQMNRQSYELNQRAAKVLAQVEPETKPPLGAVMWMGKRVN